jgi:hypothetical protein
MVLDRLKPGLTKTSSRFNISLLVAALAYLSYAAPMLFAYFESTNFLYVNAWDEETYLSYQGALGAMKVPGYWTSGAIVYVLQNLGMSGGDINVMFDCLISPLTCLLISWCLTQLGVDKRRALIYAVIIMFGPILFNFGNPLIASFLSRGYGIWGYGWEPYQSILRTPEPQLSFFLLAITTACYLKTRRTAFLFLSLPFLYFYVGIAYGYFLVAYCLSKIRFLKNMALFRRVIFIGLLSCFCIAAAFGAFDLLFISRDVFIAAFPNAYIRSHVPVIPFSGIFMVGLLVIQIMFCKRRGLREQSHSAALLFVALSIFMISNVHVISGIKLSYKNYMDYSVSLLAGAGMIIFLDFLWIHRPRVHRPVCMAMVSGILALTFRAYGFNFQEMEYHFFRGLQFTSAEDYKAAYRDPMSIIIEDRDLSAKLPYSVSRLAIPLFSYQYNFPLIAAGCRPILPRMESALAMLESPAELHAIPNLDYFKNSIDAFSGQNYVPLEKQPPPVMNDFCRSLNMAGTLHVLNNRFKDDGFVTLGLFRHSPLPSAQAK